MVMIWYIQKYFGEIVCLSFILQHRIVNTPDARQLPKNAVPGRRTWSRQLQGYSTVEAVCHGSTTKFDQITAVEPWSMTRFGAIRVCKCV